MGGWGEYKLKLTQPQVELEAWAELGKIFHGRLPWKIIKKNCQNFIDGTNRLNNKYLY